MIKRKTPLKRNQKPLKRSYIRKVSDKQKERNKEKGEKTREMHEWFKQIWDEREVADGWIGCFETDCPMHRDTYRELTSCYHHVLEKENNKFPQYRMVKRNIVIVLPGVHHQVHHNIDKTPRVKAYREELLKLHYENKLKDDE